MTITGPGLPSNWSASEIPVSGKYASNINYLGIAWDGTCLDGAACDVNVTGIVDLTAGTWNLTIPYSLAITDGLLGVANYQGTLTES